MADNCLVCGRVRAFCDKDKDNCVPPRKDCFYNHRAVEATVKYISEHNPHFKGQDDYILKNILDTLAELAASDDSDNTISTMGFSVQKVSSSRYLRVYLDMCALNPIDDDEDFQFITNEE